MKKATLGFLSLFVLLFVLSGCGKEVNKVLVTTKANQSNEATSITFAKMPSPPKCKEIIDKETIQSILGAIENSEKKEIKNDGIKGWSIAMTVAYADKSSKEYSIVGNVLRADDKKYEISEDLSKKLIAIYDSAKAEEKDYATN